MIKVETNLKKLNTVSEEIKDFKKAIKIIGDLQLTLSRHPSGVGLSAVQIGIPKNICYIEYCGKKLTIINPAIIKLGTDLYESPEGCLSIPRTLVHIDRPGKIMLEYTNYKEERITEEFDGMLSRIIQHEIEHLEGRTILDHIPIEK